MRGIRKSIRKRIRWGIIIAGIQICLLWSCQIAVKQVIVKRYERMLTEKEAILEAAGRHVYVTSDDVKAGEMLTEENVEKRYVLSEQDADTLKVEAIGMVACVDLPTGVILNTSVCQKKEYNLSDRTCTFEGIQFSDCFKAYDEVDVRIRYGNGENYCVLRKKRLLPTTNEGECCFVLSEAEQLLMSGAGFDAEMYDGAELYLVGIPNAWAGEESVSTFLPSEQVLLQLRELDESNEAFFEEGIKMRNALERRLSEHRKKQNDGLL